MDQKVEATEINNSYVYYYCKHCKKQHRHGSNGETYIGAIFSRGVHCLKKGDIKNVTIVVTNNTNVATKPISKIGGNKNKEKLDVTEVTKNFHYSFGTSIVEAAKDHEIQINKIKRQLLITQDKALSLLGVKSVLLEKIKRLEKIEEKYNQLMEDKIPKLVEENKKLKERVKILEDVIKDEIIKNMEFREKTMKDILKLQKKFDRHTFQKDDKDDEEKKLKSLLFF
jgi:hypothetical protein